MSTTKQIEFLWNKALEDAMGAGESDPYAYADGKVAHLKARLHAVERAQAGANFRPGYRPGLRQAAERRAV